MKIKDFFTGQIFHLVIRNFRYKRYYTIANIGGLAAGLTCAIFILLFLKDELTFDQHHEKKDRIYRLESEFTIGARSEKVAKTSFPFGPVFYEMFPEIESFVRFREIDVMTVRFQYKKYLESGLFYADSSIFDIFTHEFLYGTPEEALSGPNMIVLTQSMSERYFEDEDPCGNFMEFGNGIRCMVSAVISDLPCNSHTKFDGLISMQTYANFIGTEIFKDLETLHTWAFRVYTFILLKENTSIESIHDKFPVFYEQHMAELSKRLDGSFKLLSSPLTEIHLYSGLEWDFPTGDIRSIYIFMAIGIFILLIAAINYMNLATARSAGKAREVGIRKVAGASRAHLIRLFIIESIVLTLISLVVALAAADLLLPTFNQLTGKSLVLTDGLLGSLLYIIICIALLVGFIAGSYPAFYLSSFKPVNVLYGRIFPGRRKGLLRKMLICFQFFISVSLILCTIVVSRQLRHLKTADMGFDIENLIVIPVMDKQALKTYPVFREKALMIPGVEQLSTSLFTTGLSSAGDLMLVEDSGQMVRQLMGLNFINHHFLDLMGMKIIEGRDFNKKNITDADKYCLINETAVKRLGWGQDPLYKKIKSTNIPDKVFEVIGVIKDFHYAPLHQEIGPIVYFLSKDVQPNIHIRLNGKHSQKTLKLIENTWQEMHPDIPFSFIFLEQEMKAAYLNEDKLLSLMSLFTMFSIFIALLGLFSLSSYLTEKYTHEIGIRKVFGASPRTIVYHLSKQYLFLVILACILSMPVTWYLMQVWLDNFAYRTGIHLWWFIITGICVVVIAEITVIYQSLKAANRNPSETIHYE